MLLCWNHSRKLKQLSRSGPDGAEMFVICSLNGFVLQVELQVELVFLWADS